MVIITRTDSQVKRSTKGSHPDWCAADHRCGLGEHRSTPVLLDGPTARAVLVRVLDSLGRQHVSVTVCAQISDNRIAAEATISTLLADVHQTIANIH